MKRKSVVKIGALGAMTLMILVAFAGSFTTGCDPEPECVENLTVDLIAGQDFDNPVGEILIFHDNEYLYVKYMLFDDVGDCGWVIYETQLSVVVGTWEDHPQNKNLKIGNFEFTEPTDSTDKMHLYVIPWADIDGFSWDGDPQTLDIVAHAVVMKYCGGEYVQGETAYGEGDPHWKNWAMSFSYTPCEYKVPEIPTGIVTYKVSHAAYPSGDSYFKTTITNGGGGNAPNGAYLGWCIDLSHTISGTKTGELSMPSPGDADFCKWSKVNWILNNKPSDGDWEVVQAAIWHIWLGTTIKTNMGTGVSLSPAQITAAQDLADDASDKCWFRAFTGDWVAVIVTPIGSYQITIIEVDP